MSVNVANRPDTGKQGVLPAKKLSGSKNDDNQFAPNSAFFIEMFTAQRSGASGLPYFLGLSEFEFSSMQQRYLSGISDENYETDIARERGELRQQLLEMRNDEWQDVYQLLVEHRANNDSSELWLAAIVAAGCLGSSHLWRDLGLPSRDALREMLTLNFPVLAAKNDKNMRWKKFFYRQLCEQQGHYLCRSPSCEICPTYQDCFGEES